MAENKKLNTRIQLKYDSYQQWTEKNPVLLAGEVAIAKLTTTGAVAPNENDTQAPVLFKVGPGNFNDLPWASALAADVYAWAKQTEEEFIAWVNQKIEFPILTVKDEGAGKFITSITVNDHEVTISRSDVHWDDITDAPNFADSNTETTVTAGEHMGEIVDNGADGNHAYVVNGKDWSEDIAGIEVFSTSEKTVQALGGIAAGADLNGMTTREILNKLLFPYVDAVIGGATATPNGGTYEHGATQTITQVKITVTKKSEPITSIALYNGETLIEEKTGDAVKNGGTFTFSNLNVIVPTDGNQLTVKVTYPGANGVAKTVEKKTAAMTFVYPYYFGVCAADATIDAALIAGLTKEVTTKGNKTKKFTTTNQRMVFAYPVAYGSLVKIVDQNGFDVTNSFVKHSVDVVGLDENTVGYYVYANDASTNTDFAVTFNINN